MMPNIVSKIRARLVDKLKRKVIQIARRHGIHAKITPHIPTACITGSVGKTTTCRMVASILAEAGKTVALVTTQGSYVGNVTIRIGDSSSGRHASRVLLDERAQAAVFELARGGLITEGMLFDGYDIGAVLNVYDNHLGLNGVQSRQDLAQVKKTVVMNARKMAILNADDPLCLAMRDQVRSKRTCLISTNPLNPTVLEHVSDGGVAAYLDDSESVFVIKLFDGNKLVGFMPVSEIPATWGGKFRPAIHNALFATAVAHGLGVDHNQIRSALGKFYSDESSNPGRMNFYDHLPYKLLMTFADGPQATSEIYNFVSRLDIPGKKYLLLDSVDNRHDEFIMAMARSLGDGFSTYICSEHENLRKRTAGSVARLLVQGFRDRGVREDQIITEPSTDEALKRAFSLPQTGDLLVVVSLQSERAKEMGLV